MQHNRSKLLSYTLSTHTFTIAEDSVIRIPIGKTISFDLSGAGHVYGQGFNHNQPYPLDNATISLNRFEVNNIQSPIWLLSTGFVIFADTSQTLTVKLGGEGDCVLEICPPVADLIIRVYCADTLTEAHRKFIASLNLGNRLLDKGFIGDSVFCTWTQYPRCIDQEKIIFFAEEIRRNNYPSSIITIDDRWENSYGDLEFSQDFPDPAAMVAHIHSLGFKVLLWVTPFINIDSKSYGILDELGYLVKSKSIGNPGHFRWWGGEAALIDLTNPYAAVWLEEKLRQLMIEYGIDGFKIDGGDAKYQPIIEDSIWHDYAGASGYLDILLSVFDKVAPGMCESRTAWMSQSRNIIWREGGKDSVWGENNGMKAVVTLALHLSLLGYDFIIPDMSGGRMLTMSPDDPLPTDEYFIRFAECSAYFPSLQFSYFPWNYDISVSSTCQVLANIHKCLEKYIAGLLVDSPNVPILRPIWYDNESSGNEFNDLNEMLYTSGDEYMIGKDLIAAPVLESGLTQRDIILPPGEWVDIYDMKHMQSGMHRNYQALCPGIPVFVRSSNTDLLESLHSAASKLKRGTIKPGVISSSYTPGIKRNIVVTG